MISTLTSLYRATFMALATGIAFTSTGPQAQAVSPSAFKVATPATETTPKVQPVGHKRRYNRRYYRKYRGERVVEAPFTRVGSDREVDAPFTYVYSGPHGCRIVAPFVDIYIPY